MIESKRVRWIALMGAAMVTLAILYAFDPAEGGLFPPCVFHLVTGLLCPGCGLTRALHQLLHGDLVAALSLNALLPLYLLLLGALAVGWMWREAKGYTPRMLQVRASMIGIAGFAMVAFGVVRNLL